MSEHFFKVCMVRKDGGVGETTFQGYAAEGLAYNYFNQLKDGEKILFVSLVQRTSNRFGGDISWEIRSTNLKESSASAG